MQAAVAAPAPQLSIQQRQLKEAGCEQALALVQQQFDMQLNLVVFCLHHPSRRPNGSGFQSRRPTRITCGRAWGCGRACGLPQPESCRHYTTGRVALSTAVGSDSLLLHCWDAGGAGRPVDEIAGLAISVGGSDAPICDLADDAMEHWLQPWLQPLVPLCVARTAVLRLLVQNR